MSNRKDLQKNNKFFGFISKHFKLREYDHIYDLCCGRADLSYKLSLEHQVIALDKRDVRKHFGDYQFIQQDLYALETVPRDSLLVSVHACGGLTDKIIVLALESKSDFAIMTCCHNDRIYFSPRKLPSPEIIEREGRDSYLDLVRLSYILEQGYQAGIFEIPKEITPKNRIIWGKEKK